LIFFVVVVVIIQLSKKGVRVPERFCSLHK